MKCKLAGLNASTLAQHIVTAECWQLWLQIWRQAFDQIIVAVLIFQLLMIGLVGLKKAPIQAGCLIPLPFITVIFRQALLTAQSAYSDYQIRYTSGQA